MKTSLFVLILALFAFFIISSSSSDSGEVVYRDGNAYTLDGEPVDCEGWLVDSRC